MKNNQGNSEKSQEINNSETRKIFTIRKIRKNNKWTKEEDNILLYYAKVYDCKQWNKIAQFIFARTQNQCLARYARLRPEIKKGFWTNEEDQLLEKAVLLYGKNWQIISKIMKHRTGKQCRDRYLNHLDPKVLKEKFSIEEDKKILDLFATYGNSWSKISSHFNNKRTAEKIKNRYYSSLCKIVHRSQEENMNISINQKKSSDTNFSDNHNNSHTNKENTPLFIQNTNKDFVEDDNLIQSQSQNIFVHNLESDMELNHLKKFFY